MKELAKIINTKLCDISSNEDVFKGASPTYQAILYFPTGHFPGERESRCPDLLLGKLIRHLQHFQLNADI